MNIDEKTEKVNDYCDIIWDIAEKLDIDGCRICPLNMIKKDGLCYDDGHFDEEYTKEELEKASDESYHILYDDDGEVKEDIICKLVDILSNDNKDILNKFIKSFFNK